LAIWYRLIVYFGLLVALSNNPVAGKRPAAVAYNVQIVRDAFGVPHIYGRTDADAAYGLAYALAEDDFATVEPLVATARGQAGILLGRQGAVFDYGRQLLGIPAIVERDYARLPADVRAVLEGYAEGLNRYAQTHPDQVRSKKVFPVSGRDIAGGIALIAPQFYGLDRVLGRLYAGRNPSGNNAPARNNAPSEENSPAADNVPAGDGGAGDRGSNAFAVAPKKMSDGRTWLIANPHLPYSGTYALREAVVHSDEGLDMAGATLLGCPFLLLGHNRNLGWSITLNNPDLIDVYKLTLNDKGDQYLYDGKWLPLEKQKVVLPVKASILTVNASRFVYRSVHGPVILNKQGAFAIRYAGMDSLRMVEASRDGYWRNSQHKLCLCRQDGAHCLCLQRPVSRTKTWL
jgi:acyl-homoserine-lactone acylase